MVKQAWDFLKFTKIMEASDFRNVKIPEYPINLCFDTFLCFP